MDFAQSYLTVMAGVLLADGKIKPEEKRYFESLVSAGGLQEKYVKEFKEYLQGEKQVTDEILTGVTDILKKNEEYFLMTVRDSYSMAEVDKHIDEKEITFIKKFLQKINPNEKAIDYMIEWAKTSQQQMKLGSVLTKRFLEG